MATDQELWLTAVEGAKQAIAKYGTAGGYKIHRDSLKFLQDAFQKNADTFGPPPPPPVAVYEGFGAVTQGGEGQPIYEVTTLADSGPGSLRAALSLSNRMIVFRVAGTIVSNLDYMFVEGHHLTFDGTTAPAPGITIRGKGMLIRGSRGAHDIILRGIRFRLGTIDDLTIDVGAYNVIVDHCSFHGAADGNLDWGFGENVKDLTFSWNLIHGARGEGKNSLGAYKFQRTSIHHNLYSGLQRNPSIRYDDGPNADGVGGQPSPDTQVDFVNNLVRPAGGNYGAQFIWGTKANLVNNYFIPWPSDPNDILFFRGPNCDIYRSGNTHPGVPTGEVIFHPTPFPAPPITTVDAHTAACQIINQAGPYPLDSTDQALINTIRPLITPACS